MASVEELLNKILSILLERFSMPRRVISGYKDDITAGAGQRLTERKTPIKKVVVVKVRSLGGGTYISLGNEEEQEFRLTAIGSSIDIDWIDDLSKVIVNSDAVTAGVLEWNGG